MRGKSFITRTIQAVNSTQEGNINKKLEELKAELSEIVKEKEDLRKEDDRNLDTSNLDAIVDLIHQEKEIREKIHNIEQSQTQLVQEQETYQVVQGSDQTQQPQQQNPAVDPQPQPINPQLQAIMDQLKLLIDSNNNNIQCIKQLQGIVSAQSADIYNAMNSLGTLTNRVNLIAAGYIEPFAKDLPDDVASGTSN